MIDKSPRPQSRSSAGKAKSKGISVTASGGKNPGANLKPSTRQMEIPATPRSVDMSGRKDKAPPSRTAKAEIKGYLSKVAREDRETEKSQYKTLDRAMGGAAKRERQDAEAGRKDRGSRFKDGGMVRGCKGVQMSGKSFKGDF